MTRESIGELEHLILLAILALEPHATALELRRLLTEEGRRSSRGALYRSLDRLGEKGLIRWSSDVPDEERGGHTRRIYSVSETGRLTVLQRRETLERLWAGAARALNR